jgi:hypothetical protein
MHRKISSIGRGLALSAGVAIALAGAAAAALPASASPRETGISVSGDSFTGGSAPLSGGGSHKWSASLTVIGAGGTNGFGIEISTPHLGGVEQHSWTGLASASQLTISSSGVMKLTSGTALAPYVTANLTFTPTSHKTVSGNCLTGSETSYTGTLKGSVTVNTQLKGLKLKGTGLNFKGNNVLTVSGGSCQLAPCAWSSWTSPSAKDGTFVGGMTFNYPGRASVGNIDVVATTTLNKTKLTFRTDSFIIEKVPLPKFSKASKSLSFSTGDAGLITGAGSLSHGKPTSFLLPDQKTCKFNGQVYSVSGTEYQKASWKVSKTFEAHTILNGTIKLPTTGSDSFTITSLKKK